MADYKVHFEPDNKTATVPAGSDLLEAARLAGVGIKCGCDGAGTCGKCLVKVISGTAEQVFKNGNGLAVACQTKVAGDLVIEVPAASRLDGQQVLLAGPGNGHAACEALPVYLFEPLVKKVNLRLSPPTLLDADSDASRLLAALEAASGLSGWRLSLAQLSRLPEILRASGWNIDVTYAVCSEDRQIIELEGHDAGRGLYGLAVDVGTTTVVVYLVDLANGRVAGKAGSHNRQAAFGDDVITRIIHVSEEPAGLAELQQAVVITINDLAGQLARECSVEPADIRAVVTAGNTTMAHLLLGLSPRHLRLEPYVPAVSRFPAVPAAEIGLTVHPDAVVYSFPAVASYVGGDIVAGLLANGMADGDELTLFLDIGTNGEMVLGNKDWLVSCACSAGPAFEGSGITCGMRAATGAIDRLTVDHATFEVTCCTIGGTRPLGLCGSGLIDALAKLRRAGVIDRAGQLQEVPTPRLREGEAGREFVLVWAAETGSGTDIVLTEADLKNLLRAKGAVFAGVRSLLRMVDLPMETVEQVYIAGGFGSYLNVADAIDIGLLPDLPDACYKFLGNTSVQGALSGLVSSPALAGAAALADRVTYVELSAGNLFMDEFISALFLPHTDLGLFPSVRD